MADKSDYKPFKVGRPKKYTSEEKMAKDIDAYFRECEEKGKIRGVIGLANALGMTRETLCQYEKDGKFSDTIKKAKGLIAEDWEERLAMNNVAGSIFWLKNNGGMKDKTEVDTALTVKGIGVTFIDGERKSDS